MIGYNDPREPWRGKAYPANSSGSSNWEKAESSKGIEKTLLVDRSPDGLPPEVGGMAAVPLNVGLELSVDEEGEYVRGPVEP